VSERWRRVIALDDEEAVAVMRALDVFAGSREAAIEGHTVTSLPSLERWRDEAAVARRVSRRISATAPEPEPPEG
jgi:hypothetical protein